MHCCIMQEAFTGRQASHLTELAELLFSWLLPQNEGLQSLSRISMKCVCSSCADLRES